MQRKVHNLRCCTVTSVELRRCRAEPVGSEYAGPGRLPDEGLSQLTTVDRKAGQSFSHRPQVHHVPAWSIQHLKDRTEY